MSNIYFESIADYLLSLGFVIDNDRGWFVKEGAERTRCFVPFSALMGKTVADFEQMAKEEGWVTELKGEEQLAQGQRQEDLVVGGQWGTATGLGEIRYVTELANNVITESEPCGGTRDWKREHTQADPAWTRFFTLGRTWIGPAPKVREPVRVEEPVITIYLNGKVLTPGKNCQVIRLGNLWVVHIEQEEPQEDEPDLWPTLHEGLGRKGTGRRGK